MAALLFIPGFGKSPRAVERLPALSAALARFRAHFEVSIFHWPTVRGGPDAPPTWQGAAEVIADRLPDGGHIVAISGNITYALAALAKRSVGLRSLVCEDFDVPPATWNALGLPTLASAEEAANAIGSSPQGLRYRVVGVEEEAAKSMFDEMYADVDWAYQEQFVSQANTLNLLELDINLLVPALYIETLESDLPGAFERRELFKRLVPTVEFDLAPPWRSHDASTSQVFAEKAIAFMQKHSGRTILSTVLFADIVDSTVHAATMGDRRWSHVLGQFHSLASRELQKAGGKLVDTAGDGFLAVFDDPGAAIRCAMAVTGGVGELGLEARAGVHTGQVEVSAEKYSGIAVHTAARVAAKAGPGEVLVSETVRQLLAGSSAGFEERGSHELKGLPESVRLYAARAPQP